MLAALWAPSNSRFLTLLCRACARPPADDMGSGPALALLLFAAISTLHCCGPQAAAAAGGAPSLSAIDFPPGQPARRLLQAFDASLGTLSCSGSQYVAPLTITAPGLYRFRIRARGTNTDSTGERPELSAVRRITL